MKNYIKILFLSLLVVVTSCSTEEGYEDFPVESSSVKEMAGDWYVKTFVGDAMAIDYRLITTSNAATDDGAEIQIYDHKNIWWFNTKSPASVNELTFSGNDLGSDVDGYAITVTITNGAIVKDGTTSNSGKKS